MFGHGWAVSIRGDIDLNKLKSLREKMALFQAESEAISLRNAELTFDILQGKVERLGPIDNVSNDNFGINISDNGQTHQ